MKPYTNVLLDSTKLKPLTSIIDIPEMSIKTFSPRLVKDKLYPCSPKSTITKRLTPINLYEEKLEKIGKIECITKKELIHNFESGYYSFLFWTCVQTKSLGTFIVVKTPDSKLHFISMRKKMKGCNFHYDIYKKTIYTKDCDGCKFINEASHYEIPDEVIIFTTDEPYEISNVLAKI
jgi:hypothetical protein